MRGHNTIIRMRMERWKPSLVWLLVLDGPPPRRYFLDAENSVLLGGRPEVHIGSDDAPETMDLRFLTGLTVLLQGLDVDRLRRVYARLLNFEPERIITSSDDFLHEYRTEACKT